MQDKHIDEMVRRWFGEPVIAVEDEIKALITTEQLAILERLLKSKLEIQSWSKAEGREWLQRIDAVPVVAIQQQIDSIKQEDNL